MDEEKLLQKLESLEERYEALSVLLAAVWVARRWRFGMGLVASLASLAAFLVWLGVQSEPMEGQGWGRFLGRALPAQRSLLARYLEGPHPRLRRVPDRRAESEWAALLRQP